MQDYNKIIESLGIKFLKSDNIKTPLTFKLPEYREKENAILFLKKGLVRYGKSDEILKEGNAIFIPANKVTPLSFGDVGDKTLEISPHEFAFRQAEFFRSTDTENMEYTADFTLVIFETKVFDTVNFFTTLDIPGFSFENMTINNYIYEIVKEGSENRVGNQRALQAKTDLLVIEVIRHIIEHQLFVEQMATNSTYFKDPRLIRLFKHIKDNLGQELTNKTLAEIADVSEDYVGQYFKTLTGINPQDYIEYQRMEYALKLLRTTKNSIRDIGKACGYKDTAYFCRRFKMMYGIPAGKMRKRETLMNV